MGNDNFICPRCESVLPIEMKAGRGSSSCKPCKKAYHKEYYQNNKKRLSERASILHYEKMKDEEYRKKHNLLSAKWREANREKAREAKKKWRIRHPERHVLHQANRRAKINGCSGTHTAEEIQEILREQNFRCAYCQIPVKEYHVDHVVPLSRGGGNDKQNLAIACPSCNMKKGRKTAEEFMGGCHR